MAEKSVDGSFMQMTFVEAMGKEKVGTVAEHDIDQEKGQLVHSEEVDAPMSENHDAQNLSKEMRTKNRATTISAVGDPHLQNVLGERFDLVQPGIHTLLNIPQGAVLPETILFRMTALAQNFGSSCTETYFQALNLTGQWVVAASRWLTSSKEKSAQAVGGMRFSVGDNEDAENVNADSAGNSGNHSGIQLNNAYMARWLPFGPVAVKVVRGHLPGGFAYLNVFLKNVKHAGHLVGGLLGQDDHRKEATPRVGCKKLMDMRAIRRGEACLG